MATVASTGTIARIPARLVFEIGNGEIGTLTQVEVGRFDVPVHAETRLARHRGERSIVVDCSIDREQLHQQLHDTLTAAAARLRR